MVMLRSAGGMAAKRALAPLIMAAPTIKTTDFTTSPATPNYSLSCIGLHQPDMLPGSLSLPTARETGCDGLRGPQPGVLGSGCSGPAPYTTRSDRALPCAGDSPARALGDNDPDHSARRSSVSNGLRTPRQPARCRTWV